MGLFGNLFEGLSQGDETLDKTKEGLGKLMEQVEKGNTIDFDRAFQSVLLPRIVKDCEEAKKTKAQTQEIVQILRPQLENFLLMESVEKKNIDSFLNESSTLTGFEAIGKAEDPSKAAQEKVESIVKKNPKMKWVFGGISAYLLKWAKDLAKENKGEDTWLGKNLKKLANWLGGGKKEEKKEETPETATAAAKKESEKKSEETPEKLTDEEQKLVNLFKAEGYELTLDPKSIKEGLAKLEKGGTKKEGITELLVKTMTDKTGKLKMVSDKIKIELKGKPFTWNLADLLVESVKPKQMANITEVIGRIGDNPTEIRTFLNEIADEPDTKKVLDQPKYTKTKASV